MAMVLAEHELFNACRVLFGAELNITRDFLEYLQFSGLKTAYRKRALETHPDRVAILGGDDDERRHSDLFRQVQSAYENLSSYLDAREKGVIIVPGAARAESRRNHGFSRPARAAGNTTSARGWDIDNLFQGTLPERELRLGHFLYYSGYISWRQIIQALIWQRTQRPRLGEIGRRFGWLDDQDILTVLRSRRTPAPFGRAAIDLGLLTERQVQTLIWRQKSLQRKIGEFFLEEKILAFEELVALIRDQQLHNARVNQTDRFSSFRF